MNALVVASGAAAGKSVALTAALRAAGATDVVTITVPERAGKAELDPALDGLGTGRLVVAGPVGTLNDVVTRLVRRDQLEAVVVGVADDPAAAAAALTGPVRRLDLIRDDHGGVLLRSGSVAPRTSGGGWRVSVYADDTELAPGHAAAAVTLTDPEPDDGLMTASVRPGRRLRRHRTAAGRAVQIGCAEATLTVDGRPHPRPVTRWTWYVDPGRLQLRG